MYTTVDGFILYKGVICMIIIVQKRDKEENDRGTISMYYVIKLALI